MRQTDEQRTSRAIWVFTLLFSIGGLSSASAQDAAAGAAYAASAALAQPASKTSFEIYGFAMLDIGHDFKQSHSDWYGVMRPTKLPSFEDKFGHDTTTYAGVRQSRLGVRSSTSTALGDLRATFNFELFGTVRPPPELH